MNINNDVRIISWHRDNATNDRPSVSELYSANANLEKTGTDINGPTRSSNGSLTLRQCRAGVQEKYPTAILQSNGKIILEECLVLGDIRNKNGNTSLNKTTTEGDLINLNGATTLRESHIEDIKSANGHVALTRSTADFIIAENGKVSLEDYSVIKYNVTLKNGGLSMESSTIGGTLELKSNNLEIGKNSSVHHLKMNCVNDICVVASSFNSTSNAKIVINGIRIFPKKDSNAPAEKPTQVLILREGAELHQVEFNGKNLIMNLEGNASYTGGEMKGLTINRIK